MKILHLAIVSFGLGAAVGLAEAGPFSTEPDGDALVSVELIVEEGALTPGGTSHLGVVFSMEPDWHIYWRNAGDTGLAPSVELDLPKGVSAGPMQWPAPTWYEHAGLLDFIYEDQVTLIVPLRVDNGFDQSQVTIRASVDWLVCREECLPGAAQVSVSVPVGEPSVDASTAELFAATRARLPRPADAAANVGIAAQWEGRTLIVSAPDADRLRFFSFEPAQAPPSNPLRDGQSNGARLRIEYDSRIANRPLVSGVLEVRQGETTKYFTISIPGPRT